MVSHPPSGAPFRAALLAPERLSDRLAARLISQIEHGALKPGDRLPTEVQLSQTHGVSRSVVREALHQVKSRGLLRSRQGSGVFVDAPPAHHALSFDPMVLESLDAVLQVVELRRVLEGEMAALAAQRATRAQVTCLKRALRTVEDATDAGQPGVDEDFAFHRAIGQATGNPQFERLLAHLSQYLLEAMRVTRANEQHRADFVQQVRVEHRAIAEAIAAHDPACARRAAIDHLLHAEQRLEEGGVIPRRLPRPPRARPAAPRRAQP